MVATHNSDGNEKDITDIDTTKGNSPNKLLANREIPAIIPVLIPLVNQVTADGVATIGWNFHAVCVLLYKDIITGAMRGIAGVIKYPMVVN